MEQSEMGSNANAVAVMKCADCGHIGEPREYDAPAPRARSADDTYPIPYCSACQSTDVAPVVVCLTCGQHEPEEGCDHCTACLDALEAEQDALVAAYNSRLQRTAA